jgi:hypothetical protein
MTQEDMRRLLTPAQAEQMAATTRKQEAELEAAKPHFPVGTRVRTWHGAEGIIIEDHPTTTARFTFRVRLDDGLIVRQAPDCLTRLDGAA